MFITAKDAIVRKDNALEAKVSLCVFASLAVKMSDF